MRLRQIEVFHAVYSAGSVTSAANILHVSQPSVSKVLAHAEQQLGYALFERSKGKLIPTPEAHRLFKHVSTVYRDIDRLRHVAENLRLGDSGRVRIASTPAFGLDVLPRAIASFRKEHEHALFEIETLHLDELNDALLEGRVDIGLAFEPLSSPGIEQQSLATGRFVVLAPADEDFGDKTSLNLGDIADRPFIALNSRGPLGQSLSTHFASSGVELNIVTWTETYHVAKALVARGVGITITDEITARSGSSDDIQIFALTPRLEYRINTLRLASEPLSVLGTNFVEHLKDSLRDFLRTP
jgi:DNA-binding transcriptional LysR family regulator